MAQGLCGPSPRLSQELMLQGRLTIQETPFGGQLLAHGGLGSSTLRLLMGEKPSLGWGGDRTGASRDT